MTRNDYQITKYAIDLENGAVNGIKHEVPGKNGDRPTTFPNTRGDEPRRVPGGGYDGWEVTDVKNRVYLQTTKIANEGDPYYDEIMGSKNGKAPKYVSELSLEDLELDKYQTPTLLLQELKKPGQYNGNLKKFVTNDRWHELVQRQKDKLRQRNTDATVVQQGVEITVLKRDSVQQRRDISSVKKSIAMVAVVAILALAAASSSLSSVGLTGVIGSLAGSFVTGVIGNLAGSLTGVRGSLGSLGDDLDTSVTCPVWLTLPIEEDVGNCPVLLTLPIKDDEDVEDVVDVVIQFTESSFMEKISSIKKITDFTNFGSNIIDFGSNFGSNIEMMIAIVAIALVAMLYCGVAWKKKTATAKQQARPPAPACRPPAPGPPAPASRPPPPSPNTARKQFYLQQQQQQQQRHQQPGRPPLAPVNGRRR